MNSIATVRVELGERSYDVIVGAGARRELPAIIPSQARRAAIITQPGIPVKVDPGIPFDVFEIGTGEGAHRAFHDNKFAGLRGNRWRELRSSTARL